MNRSWKWLWFATEEEAEETRRDAADTGYVVSVLYRNADGEFGWGHRGLREAV